MMIDNTRLMLTLRDLLKVGAGVMIARGVGDAAVWEAVIGAAVMAVGWWLSDRHNAKLKAQAQAAAKVMAELPTLVGRA